MDQVTAQQLFFYGGILVLDGLVGQLEFGLDLNFWRTGDKFKGVKMIPPGLHFISFRSISGSFQELPPYPLTP